ncbi:glycerate kinase [Lentilactobacillus kosonis]|uniref:Glycerate kinase n=1 Tax=Lentilactobacillus kosonis TaxID=2810561 RepID=A0A401FI64_9LACO|nr:glycerate kinase [Lentilactobacillus kosonis]GAY71988.1 glycerate kinase [Lentilactobacillus kosonis]
MAQTPADQQQTFKIVIAPDSYKGYLTALEAAQAIKVGCEQVIDNADYELLPLADGGEGTTITLVNAKGGRLVTEQVEDPWGNLILADYGLVDDGRTAVIETAAASGFQFIDFQQPQIGLADTFGTGQLIKSALDHGVTKIIVGLGGSATNDGGAGLLTALGASLLDAAGKLIPRGGLGLTKLARIDVHNLDQRLKHVTVVGATDVTNPLTGKRGATAVFGPQKGADPVMIERLDAALANYGEVIKHDLGIDVVSQPGSGAAGGLGAGLIAGLKATLTSGINLALKEIAFANAVQGANLVITGEGSIDDQTQYGKAPSIVAQQARIQAPDSYILGIGGQVGDQLQPLYDQGFNRITAIQVDPKLGDPKENAQANLTQTTSQLVSRIL